MVKVGDVVRYTFDLKNTLKIGMVKDVKVYSGTNSRHVLVSHPDTIGASWWIVDGRYIFEVLPEAEAEEWLLKYTQFSSFSIDKLRYSMIQYDMAFEYQLPLINFLLYGISPGLFFTAFLENDYNGAILNSHPLNSIPALKPVSYWLQAYLHHCPYIGSREALTNWYTLSDVERRTVLETMGLVYTEEQEIELALKA